MARSMADSRAVPAWSKMGEITAGSYASSGVQVKG